MGNECLGDKPIARTLEDLNEGYSPIYTGALGIPKENEISYTNIRFYEYDAPERKGPWFCLCD